MAEQVKNKYVIRVDQICSNCGYRNILNDVLDDEITVIACGSCGKFLMVPKEMTDEDKKIVRDVIHKAMKEVK